MEEIDEHSLNRIVSTIRTPDNPVSIYSVSDDGFWSHLNFSSPDWTEGCSVPCRFSKNIQDFENSDIVWSHELTEIADLLKHYPSKKPKKIAVLTLENFYRSSTLDNLIGRFYLPQNTNFQNWISKIDILVSMSKYSDIIINYFYGLSFKDKHFHTPEIVKQHLSQALSNETKKTDVLASSWISNCFSVVRNTYMKELSRHMKIDHYGKCFNSGLDGRLYDKVTQQSKYKFILAFENTIQTDYLSEKYFGALRSNSVLVYFGAPNMHEYSPVEGRIGINALDYTPKELAQYLTELANNDEKYNEYLNWKKKDLRNEFLENSRKDFLVKGKDSWICRLCENYHKRFD